jgi:hypothetical protein
MVENNQNIETINTKKNSANITQFGITVKFKTQRVCLCGRRIDI